MASEPAGVEGDRATDRGELEPGTRRLRLQSDKPLRLSFEERGSVVALLTGPEGDPVEGIPVSFALVGRAQDASLQTLSVESDGEGLAENTVLSGRSAATFAVQISAPGAYDLTVEVAVSDAGFGTLHVTAPYSGERAVARRVVFAQAGARCGETEREPGDPMATLGGGEDRATFLALPAAVEYAVTAEAEGQDGAILARACIDGVRVLADREVEAAVTFTDEPLLPTGQFVLDTQLDTTVPAVTLTAILRSAAETLVRRDTLGNLSPSLAQGRFLLDSLDGALRNEPLSLDPEALLLADAIAQARASTNDPLAEQTLEALLVVNGEGPFVALPRIDELASRSLSDIYLSATLTIGPSGVEAPVAWQTSRVEATPLLSGGAPVFIDVSMLAPAEVEAEWRASEDRLALSSVRLTPLFGALAARVLRKVVSFDETGFGTEIRELVGCPTLEEWLRDQSFATGACEEACVTAACDRALARLVGAAETALLALDQTRPTLELSGELELRDDDGDLFAEQMSTEALRGQWHPASTGDAGDPVVGTASATALPEEP